MTFEAKYAGRCAECDDQILVGEFVDYDHEDELVHAECVRPLRRSGKPACPVCWLVHAGGCYE